MQIAIVFVALFAAVLAVPVENPGDPNGVYIVKQQQDNRIDGYNFEFETSDGTQRREDGTLKQIGENEGIAVSGSYSYVGPDGVVYTVNYIADENGFQPQGAHIPSL